MLDRSVSLPCLVLYLVSAVACQDPRALRLSSQHLHGSIADVEEAYRLAAAKPDLLDHIPCFCGCEAFRHKAVTICFVRKRDQSGTVAERDYHGAKCALCVDVVRSATRMQSEGVPIAKIRNLLESKYHHTGKRTPTPPIQ
jgi:hypothetical protein